MFDDQQAVQAQYATEDNLATRRSVWQPAADGRDLPELVFEAVRALLAGQPSSYLEVGCGTGQFAARVAQALPTTTVLATDQSPRMVELTAARSPRLRTAVASAAELPGADGEYDVVAALWMLYHVPSVEAALREFRRVLAPGGALMVVTNGDEHVARLRRDAGGGPAITGFSSENAEPQLARFFDVVRREDVASRAVFPDHPAAMAYLRSSSEAIEWDLPWFDGPREYAGASTLFVCR